MPSSKRVILTGPSGLIGKEAIAPLKEAGFDIYALTIDKNNPANGAHYIPCNLFDAQNLAKVFEEIKPQYLLNFAWATTEDYLTSNINFDFLAAGLNLMKYFHKNGGKRAVFAGTCLEYAFKDTLLKETDALDPKTVYAKCKHSLNELASLYAAQNNISFGWGRIFYVYGRGEHEKRLTAHIINSLRAGKEVEIKHSGLSKDYMYTKDIAAAFVKFLDGGVTGGVNICTGRAVTLADYARAIAKKLNKENLLILKDLPSSQPALIAGDNTRLKNEVGFTPRYSLEAGLEEIL